MKLSVLQTSSTPVYRQIYDEISAQILSGEIAGGEALPPIRTVSRELGVSVITVRSAWDALESDGLIVARAGSGCFAADIPESERKRMRYERIEGSINALVADAKKTGVGRGELIELIGKRFD